LPDPTDRHVLSPYQGWEPRRDELLKLASHMLNDARQFEAGKPLIEVAATAALETAK
jgi:hypothetical protein